MSKYVLNEENGRIFPYTEALIKKPNHVLYDYYKHGQKTEKSSPKYTKENLTEMMRGELMKIASGYKIPEPHKMKNVELVDAIYKSSFGEEADTASS